MKNIKGPTWQLLGTLYRPTYYSLMTQVSLGDLVICSVGGSVFEGIVMVITMRGVILDNHKMRSKGNLVKWCNVLEIKEKSIRVPVMD